MSKRKSRSAARRPGLTSGGDAVERSAGARFVPAGGRVSLEIDSAALPDAQILGYAGVCGVVDRGAVVEIWFGDSPMPEAPLRYLARVAFPIEPFVNFWDSGFAPMASDLRAVAQKMPAPAHEIHTSYPWPPSQAAVMASAARVARFGWAATLEFYFVRPFAAAMHLRGLGPISVEALLAVQVDAPTLDRLARAIEALIPSARARLAAVTSPAAAPAVPPAE
jgi:hypothetical protein